MILPRLVIPLLQIPVPTDSIPDHRQEIEMLKSLPVDELINKVVNYMVSFTINLTIAILVFYIGKFIINKIHRLLVSIFARQDVDRSLSTFILSMIRIVLFFILIVTVIGILGIETSSFIAIFASAGVAIGMALSGTLQNFAGGVLILLLKPYKVGDYIEAQGYAGSVKEIQIFNTIITTPDNKYITIPNGGLSTSSINNYSREKYRRVEWTVSISYGDSIEDARTAILDILYADKRIVKKYIEDTECNPITDPGCEINTHDQIAATNELNKHGRVYWLLNRKKQRLLQTIEGIKTNNDNKVTEYKNPKVDRSPQVKLNTLADSSVNLVVRVWAKNTDYWGVYFDMNEKFYTELPKHGINFPFPQMDVHIKSPSHKKC